jgi:two-component system OmpR family response regulator
MSLGFRLVLREAAFAAGIPRPACRGRSFGRALLPRGNDEEATSMRILIVEDDAKISSFVVKGLRQAGFTVDMAADGEQGFQLAMQNPYDAAVIDIMLPKLDGLTLIHSLRKNRVNTPVLILSARDSLDDRIRGFRQGGDDYVTKPFSFSELLVRVQALIRRSTMESHLMELHYSDLSMDLLTRKVKRGEEPIELQPKEFTLLEYLLRNAENVLSKAMILENVWGYDFDPQTNPVDVLVHRLRAKVDADQDRKLIHTVRGVGYVLREV